MKNLNINDIHFPKPCPMNWDKMQNHKDGKFCTGCNKVVYDFSNVSEEYFSKILREIKDKLCCSFYTAQLPKHRSENMLKFTKAAKLAGVCLLTYMSFYPTLASAQVRVEGEKTINYIILKKDSIAPANTFEPIPIKLVEEEAKTTEITKTEKRKKSKTRRPKYRYRTLGCPDF